MRGSLAVLILLFWARATSKSGRISRILERNKLLVAPQDESALHRRYYQLRGSSGVVLAHFFPFLHGIKTKTKTKSGHQQTGRGGTKPIFWFKHHSKCPLRKAWFSRILPVKESEESFLDRIGQKIVEQGVLQALAFDLGHAPGSNK